MGGDAKRSIGAFISCRFRRPRAVESVGKIVYDEGFLLASELARHADILA